MLILFHCGLPVNVDIVLLLVTCTGRVTFNVSPCDGVYDMTYYVSSGTLNPTHSLTHSPCDGVYEWCIQYT